MNNCKHIKDLILTDYADGQADALSKKKVEDHLLSCASCQAFAREVHHVIGPFEKANRKQVPEELWMNIKENIQYEQNSKAGFFENMKEWFSGLTLPRLVPALVSVVIVFFVSSTVFFNQQIKQAETKEAGAYVDFILSSQERSIGADEGDFGSPIEQYFL